VRVCTPSQMHLITTLVQQRIFNLVEGVEQAGLACWHCTRKGARTLIESVRIGDRSRDRLSKKCEQKPQLFSQTFLLHSISVVVKSSHSRRCTRLSDMPPSSLESDHVVVIRFDIVRKHTRSSFQRARNSIGRKLRTLYMMR
jgi:hypothetical protein